MDRFDITSEFKSTWSARFDAIFEGAARMRHALSEDGYRIMLATVFGNESMIDALILRQHRLPDERHQRAWQEYKLGEQLAVPSFWQEVKHANQSNMFWDQWLCVSNGGADWNRVDKTCNVSMTMWMAEWEIQDTRERKQAAIDHKAAHDDNQCLCDAVYYEVHSGLQGRQHVATNLERVEYNVYLVKSLPYFPCFASFPGPLFQCIYDYLCVHYDPRGSHGLHSP